MRKWFKNIYKEGFGKQYCWLKWILSFEKQKKLTRGCCTLGTRLSPKENFLSFIVFLSIFFQRESRTQGRGVGAIRQGRVCVKVRTKSYPKTGWVITKMLPKPGYHIELTYPKLELETSVFGTNADAELHCLVNVSLP